jgi:hypothetical protein
MKPNFGLMVRWATQKVSVEQKSIAPGLYTSQTVLFEKCFVAKEFT